MGTLRGLVLLALDALLLLLLPLLWVIRRLFLFFGPRNRISVWTGAPVITVAKNCRAERLIGFNAISVVCASYYITDEFDWVLSRLVGNNRFLAILISYVAFAAACVVTEQVHAYADGGLLPSRQRRKFNRIELLAHRLLGIRLLIWTYGGDVRTRSRTLALGEPNCCSTCEIGRAHV